MAAYGLGGDLLGSSTAGYLSSYVSMLLRAEPYNARAAAMAPCYPQLSTSVPAPVTTPTLVSPPPPPPPPLYEEKETLRQSHHNRSAFPTLSSLAKVSERVNDKTDLAVFVAVTI